MSTGQANHPRLTKYLRNNLLAARQDLDPSSTYKERKVRSKTSTGKVTRWLSDRPKRYRCPVKTCRRVMTFGDDDHEMICYKYDPARATPDREVITKGYEVRDFIAHIAFVASPSWLANILVPSTAG